MSISLDTVPFIKEGGAMDLLHDFDQRGISIPSTYVTFVGMNQVKRHGGGQGYSWLYCPK